MKNKNKVGSVVAGVAGAVAIAGVAVAATMALKDKKSREKVKKVLVNVKDQAMDYVETLKKEPNVKETTSKVKKIAEDTKKVVDKNT
ncbi:MAG: hypothetical protein COX78_03295 [Candidatus Levybacteria bacterium CG_4_10_14_0_2_um_filter_35_8]|nr:MAG: hypothetical protein COW87_04320 [Candidatus Levybacteria bacterium CG22_combo_CG10-13_8_21_14_all_35_11]PIY94478.1 MAG: hypothetical protein COY68_02875 [Candidatus Levybacteria bacterium CG_4_10_14_0_8_um_filter_35_23]PIZ98346.1 MAG: hypothetical protein COX78_03295 [Candidatus Levybacteria bacterium CG_4_10_14_0_2_um_filter_35_8]PJC54606.1 MAG: hypothetical protein CO028_01580 [Candidatus Levybacteria bacterium CG_4_9_14_0_2_um_filter_35_21]